MTETKKKGPKKKSEPVRKKGTEKGKSELAKERTRATNPIYQGAYTIKDYLRGGREGHFTTHERLEFINRFIGIPPEEKARLDRIDELAKGIYKGPTTWECGEIYDIPEYLTGNITGLDYYRQFYELDDNEAIAKRLEQIQAMADYMESKNIVFLEVKKAIGERHPEYMEALKERTALIEKTRLGVTKEAEELREDLARTSETVIYQYPGAVDYDTPINEAVQRLQGEIKTLKEITGVTYDELKANTKGVILILEREITEDVFNQEFQAFRMAHPGEGYQDAIVRVFRGAVWDAFQWGIGDLNPDIAERTIIGAVQRAIAQQKRLKDNLESYRVYIEGDGPTDHKGPDQQIRGPSTLIYAKTHPTPERKNAIVSHGPVTNEITRRNPNPAKIQLRLEGDYNKHFFKIIQNRETRTTIKGHIDTVGNVRLNTRHQTIMSTLASVLIERTPDAFYNGTLNAKEDILETELIARCYGIDKRNVTTEYKEQFRADMLALKGSLYTGEWADYMKENKAFREKIKREFPEYNGNGRVKISLIDYDMYETLDAQGNSSWHYVINRFPILDYLDINTGMASKLRYSIKETPVILWDSVPEKIKASMDELATHKMPTIQLYKEDRDGKRYIPTLQTREKSVFMDCILRELEAHNRYGWIDNTKYFDLDLNRIYEDVWGDTGEVSKKTKVERKTALISYIYRLWIEYETKREKSENAQVHGITILTTGPGWTKARIYLRDPLETPPAIMKDPDGPKKKKA